MHNAIGDNLELRSNKMDYKKVTAYWRLFLFFLVVCFVLPPYYVVTKINKPLGYKYGRFLLRSWLRALGHKATLRGEILDKKPVIYAVNHISYVDILVCGMFLKGRYVAKEEVEGWPLFGKLTTLQGSVYIKRTKTATADGKKMMMKVIEEPDSLILFPEGTTSDGLRVLPFGSSFFDVAIEADVMVQPITIAYAGCNGMPMPHWIRKMVGWDSPILELWPHLSKLIEIGNVQVIVTAHPPLNPKDFKSRKELAKASWEAVNNGLFNSFKPVKVS